ncbi:MAG: hypothetical protein U0168_22780 [Nannocystaceae bacterium]|jgi:hypothetical protein
MTDDPTRATPPVPLDPALLERLRRGVPLVLHEGGRWWMDGAPVTHPGVHQALLAGLDVSERGEPIVALGPQWCYVTLRDTPLRVLAVDLAATPPLLRLDDGRTVALEPASLVEDDDRGLRCTVPSQRSGAALRARFTNRAQADLAPALAWDEHADAAVLTLGGSRHVIPRAH